MNLSKKWFLTISQGAFALFSKYHFKKCKGIINAELLIYSQSPEDKQEQQQPQIIQNTKHSYATD